MAPSHLQFATPSTRWAALVARDPAASNAFIYAVTTTKIYCRPTCSSRLARRANVAFYTSPAEAKRAGFRACKRCKPDSEAWDARQGQREMVERACRAIVEKGDGGAQSGMSLEELARGAGRTKSHFHRVFRRVVGMTPRVYGEVVRKQRGMERDGEVVDAESVSESTGGSENLSDGTGESTPGFEGTGSDYGDLWGQSVGNAGRTCGFDYGLMEMESGAKDDIEYTIQPWSSGFVLIAATCSGVCFLDAGDSEDELLGNLKTRFPQVEMRLSEWWWGVSLTAEVEDVVAERCYGMFEAVMEALIQPSGKMLDVTFDVPCVSLAVEGQII